MIIESNNAINRSSKTMITICLVDDGNKIRSYLYINSVLDNTASQVIQLQLAAGTDLYVGCWKGTDYFYNGVIDEISIYNVRVIHDERD